MNDTEHRTDEHEPSPEHPAKPDAPTQLRKRSWKYLLGRTVREFSADQCMDAAAALTYYAVLSMFPAMIAVFSLLGVVGQRQQAVDAVLGIVEDVAPGEAAAALRGPIEQLAQAPGAGFALVTGIVIALWSASGYVGAFGRAMNRVYEIEEGRPFWKLRPVQLMVTVIVVVALAIVAGALVVSGDLVGAIGKALGVGPGAMVAWKILRWPLLLAVVILLVAVLYHFTPNARQPRFRWISLGAVLAIVVLAVASLLFGVYVATFSHYDRTYGSLAGVIVFLLWLWIANLALLLGAEFDAELERARELQGGIAAEREIRLPARDTRQSEKRAEREKKTVEEGRRIRNEHEDDTGDER